MLIAYDFSYRWFEKERWEKVCPNVDFTFLSCSDLEDEKVEALARSLLEAGCGAVIAARGGKDVVFMDSEETIRYQPKLVQAVDTLGAGPLYGTAYSLANCHLMEMDWKNAIMIHSGEYFHGPFEMTTKDQAMILLMSTGRSRFLDERVLKFLNSYAGHVLVIDAKDTGIEKRIDPRIAEFFNSVVMIPLERFFVYQLAQLTGHSFDDRHYMWKVEY